MKSFIKFFICGITLFSFSSLHAQNSLFSTTRFLPDTSVFNSQDNAYTTIKWLGTTPYSDFLKIYFATDTNLSNIILLDSIPQVNFQNQNDTIQIISSILFDSANGFQGGNNIVVVWSSGNAIAPADSLHDNVYLKILAGTDEINLFTDFSIYPTLAKDFITIESSEDIFPKKIFITDVSGRILKILSSLPDSKNRIKVNISELNSGIYFLDMLLPDKQRVVSKFVKID